MTRSRGSRVTIQDAELTSNKEARHVSQQPEGGQDEQEEQKEQEEQDEQNEQEEQDQSMDFLFQNVVFYLNLFLGKTRAAELEATLCSNGATRSSYVNDESNTTHIITDDLDFPYYKYAEAREIHIVTPEWVSRSISSGRLQNPQYFSANPKMIFSGIVLATSKLPLYDRKLIREAVEAYGGHFTLNLTSDVTHIIAPLSIGRKCEYAMSHPEWGIKLVLPHWFQLCLNLKRRLPETIYQLPNPPMSDPDYVVQEQVQGYAPQLYVNNTKGITMFLKMCGENQTQFLDGFYIHIAGVFLPQHQVYIEEEIKEAGGILVDEYSNDAVDIVVCRYREGEVYIKASTDGKTIGSPDWLLHILRTGEISSPKASLLHYPVPPMPIEGMSSLVITITNYSGRIREYLKRMIQTVGATYSNTMSHRGSRQPTTHIICGRTSGEKFDKGNEWNIRIVNHLWLEECFHAWSLQSETKPRYTAYPTHNQLSAVFGTKILPDSLEKSTAASEDEELLHLEVLASETSTLSETTLTDMLGTGGQRDRQELERYPNNTGVLSSNEFECTPPQFVPSKESPNKPSTTPKRVESDSPMLIPSAPSSPVDSSPAGSSSLGSVRVVSRKRGAALQASKALQKIVPEMNEFQEELRDEKKALKKKKKPISSEEFKEADSMDMDVDETDNQSSSTKKVAVSLAKRKRISAGSEVRGVSVGSDDDDDDVDKETETSSNELKASPKKHKRVPMADKDKGGEDSAVESATMLDQPAGAGASVAGAAKQKRVRYITTGVKEQSASQIKALKALSITPTTTVEKCTHLVATSITRTGKFLIALLQGASSIFVLDEDNFRIEDPTSEQKLGINLYESLDRAREKRVFDNCVFYLSPSMKQDMPGLKAVIEAGGGKAPTLLQAGIGSLKNRLVKANQSTTACTSGVAKSKTSGRLKDDGIESGVNNESDEDDDEPGSQREKEIVAVVSSEKDKDMWQPILDAGAHVYSHDVISLSVLTQQLDLGKTHALAQSTSGSITETTATLSVRNEGDSASLQRTSDDTLNVCTSRHTLIEHDGESDLDMYVERNRLFRILTDLKLAICFL
ncbi:hypothetical protein BGZ65_007320 [Modicella reniformis]|uniref:BRCT domain-containing protein n=1 Tax=Modicella reniformis TaxID=1440133 RepID=A0A9P6SV47_9FUNG|nr:hypothetical protein BGZ65_007320 [Modicella reniformis]